MNKGSIWSEEKEYTFPVIGRKVYERVYTLSELTKKDDSVIAAVKMEAIPGGKGATPEGEGGMFLGNLDKTGTYTGDMTFNVTTGKVINYTEKMVAEWVMANPEDQKGNKQPEAVRMGTKRIHSIEKVQ